MVDIFTVPNKIPDCFQQSKTLLAAVGDAGGGGVLFVVHCYARYEMGSWEDKLHSPVQGLILDQLRQLTIPLVFFLTFRPFAGGFPGHLQANFQRRSSLLPVCPSAVRIRSQVSEECDREKITQLP